MLTMPVMSGNFNSSPTVLCHMTKIPYSDDVITPMSMTTEQTPFAEKSHKLWLKGNEMDLGNFMTNIMRLICDVFILCTCLRLKVDFIMHVCVCFFLNHPSFLFCYQIYHLAYATSLANIV